METAAVPLPWGVTDLEMWAGDTSGDLFEERLLDLHKLCGFDDVQDLLQLA